MNLLFILLFGMAGVLARYTIASLITALFPSQFPWGTFAINLLGCFLIGLIYVLGVEKSALSQELRLGLMVGFLGGFTTFSAYSLDGLRLLEQAQFLPAALYLTLSPLCGLLATFSGMWTVRKFL